MNWQIERQRKLREEEFNVDAFKIVIFKVYQLCSCYDNGILVVTLILRIKISRDEGNSRDEKEGSKRLHLKFYPSE